MASLYPRGKYIWVKYKINGKLIRESLRPLSHFYKEDKKAAETILLEKKFLERKNSGNIPIDRYRDLTLQDAWTMFLSLKKLSVKKKSAQAYEHAYSAFKKYINPNVKVKTITEEIINQYKIFLRGKAYNTIVNYLNHLRIFFEYLRKENYIISNPVKQMRGKQMPISIITEEDKNNILNYFKKKNLVHYRFVNLLFLTGLRTGEAVDLRWEDIDFNQKLLNIRNTKANRIDAFPLYDELYNFLLYWRNKGKLFPYTGNQGSLKFWNRGLKELNMNYSLHDIRRTFGTGLAKSLSPYELQIMMRHESIKTTMRYYISINVNEIGRKIQAQSKAQ